MWAVAGLTPDSTPVRGERASQLLGTDISSPIKDRFADMISEPPATIGTGIGPEKQLALPGSALLVDP
ncbi:hypothetical protein ACCAA_770005 [Candidatus Accumulibacter aalborgensis]|uniref:Uncharacterized protein n=1 Tax=Candidatus Accumulibacter aalborgensis TaxID=1860102 RepID=A0A1A8XYL4_9PROT|nr:hypothetical protein ACCAA_770005 [Candidatus Accumulibacter aalborgensis]